MLIASALLLLIKMNTNKKRLKQHKTYKEPAFMDLFIDYAIFISCCLLPDDVNVDADDRNHAEIFFSLDMYLCTMMMMMDKQHF